MSKTWVQTHSSIAFDLLDPRPENVYLDDIAVALSRINRFAGHTQGAGYSVAQHSLLVLDLMPRNVSAELRLAALLHDAHEAYTGDITTPVKAALLYLNGGKNDALQALQRCIQATIHEAFGLGEIYSPLIHEADVKALAVEKARFMGPEPKSWGDLPVVTEEDGAQWLPWPSAFTARMFNKTARRLSKETGRKPLATLGVV